jgi:hypothetical protein
MRSAKVISRRSPVVEVSIQPISMPQIPSLWREFAAIAFRRPRPSALISASYPAGERYSVANGPVSSILVPVVFVGLLGDIPLSLVIAALCHPTYPALVHGCIAALGLLSLSWAIAARSAVRAIPHVVSDDALWIGGGVRLAGVIPKAAIERVVGIRGSRREWMSEHGVGRGDITPASGFDPPNLAVEIRKSATVTVRIGSRGKCKTSRRWILLYVDRPSALLTTAALWAASKSG